VKFSKKGAVITFILIFLGTGLWVSSGTQTEWWAKQFSDAGNYLNGCALGLSLGAIASTIASSFFYGSSALSKGEEKDG
jgi:hypothetical protein